MALPPPVINPGSNNSTGEGFSQDLVETRSFVPLENTGEGGAVNLDRPDDVIRSYKRKMGDYLSKITKESGNRFYVSPGSEDVSTRGTDGNPLPILTQEFNDSTNSNQLREVRSPEAINNFKTTSRSGMLDRPGRPFVIKKGKSSSEDQTVESIYAELNDQGNSAPFALRVQEVLSENGQFSESRPFINRDVVFKEGNLAVTRIQRTLGEHGPRKFPSVVQGSKPEDIVSLKELKKLGALIMLNASGELVIPKDPTGLEFLTTLVPGVARVGGKVPVSRFSAVNAYKDANPTFEKPNSTSFIENDGILSYGNTNSYAVTFTGITSAPSIITASLLMLTVGGLLKLLALTLQKPTPAQGAPDTSREGRAKRLGNFRVKKENHSFLHEVGFTVDLTETQNDFMACVSKGIDVFFGIEDALPGVGGFITSATSQLTKLHGYYNVILRNIVRNAIDLALPGISSITAIGDSESSGSDQESAATDLVLQYNPVTLLDKLNRSPLIKFINTVAKIGDIAISTEQYDTLADHSGLTSVMDLIDQTDLNGGGLNPSILQAKNRLSDGKLAWRQTSIKSLYILPQGLIGAGKRFSNAKASNLAVSMLAGNNIDEVVDNTFGGYGNNSVIASNENITNGNRIKTEIVEKMEDYLERDYMPFYFHDIRTNEIIAFHAFLDNVTDGFDAEYNESDGFGRVDKVHTYKSTTRSISISFRLVAVDPEDFNEMWFKVNKLVTLVYPQWSKGREVKWGDNKMIQPFSQHPAASPMMRLRLGDLFKTNYTKFALARLFGISNQPGDFNLEGVNALGETTSQQRLNDEIRTITNARSVWTYSVGDTVIIKPNASMDPHNLGNGYHKVEGNTTRSTATARRSERVDNTVHVVGGGVRAIVLETTQGGSSSTTFKLRLKEGSEQDAFIASTNDIELDRTDIQMQASNRAHATSTSTDNAVETTTVEGVEKFLDENKNPVFKAFASTKGRGLAGFIKSLRFDYNESKWQTNTFNGRAPMMIKVDIEFVPVHDIAPGIDHNGFMTAPVYNVGDKMMSLGYDKSPETLLTAFNNSQNKLGQYSGNTRNTTIVGGNR